MKKINKIYMLASLFLLLLAACKKEGEIIIKPIKGFKPYKIEGFAIQPLEQYFDGVKVREIYGSASLESQIAFDTDELTMELKGKRSGETFYQQKFMISNTTNTVPKFYFDGTMHDTFTYPNPQEGQYLANFYFDFPKALGPVDIVVVMQEYYYDWDLNDDPKVVLGTTSFPLISNIQPGKWSDTYFVLPPLPPIPTVKKHPESEFLPYVCVKKAGTDEYYGNQKMEDNSFQLQFPSQNTSEGKVQSIFVGWTQMGSYVSMQPQQDLVQLFPH